MADAIIIDTKTLIIQYEIGGADAWNIYLSDPARRIILPSTILDEVTFGNGPIGSDFLAWRAANSSRVISLEVSIQEVRDFYNRPSLSVGAGNNAGDFAIRYIYEHLGAYSAELGGLNIPRLMTDDFDFFNQMRNNPLYSASNPFDGTFGFLIEERAAGRLTEVEFRSIYARLVQHLEAATAAGIPLYNQKWLDSFKQLDLDVLAEVNSSVDTSHMSGAKIFLITVGAEALRQAGIVGDVISFADAVARADELEQQGRYAEAQQVWAEFAGDLAGGALGALSGTIVALLLVPEGTSKLAAGAIALVGAIIGSVAGSTIGQQFGDFLAEEIQQRIANGEAVTVEDVMELFDSFAAENGIDTSGYVLSTDDGLQYFDDNECFLAGSPVALTDGSTKPIDMISVGDIVLSYDATGALVPGRVTRTFRNEVSHLLDVHGLKVTPGHVTLCGDGIFKGRNVPIIDILLSDGALVTAKGELIRIAINVAVGSFEDGIVKVLYALTADDARSGTLREGEMRVGTLLFDREGLPVSVLDCLKAEGLVFVPETGLVAKPGEAPHALRWFGPLPRPEDYVLTRSRETLEGILVDGEWEGSRSELIVGRLRRTAEVMN
jgi:hypothetical protein